MTKEKFVVDLYIRVSTDRQAKEGDSLEEQESELKKFCEYRGYQIYKVYIEKGRSGGNTKRPEYQNLLGDVSKGKINAVVVKKLDRLSRSLLDFEEFMRLLQEKDVEFISLKENFDTTSAMGKAMLRVALVFAQLEREQTSERLVDVMGYRASQGLFNGGTPAFGYTNANKELIPYPKEKIIVEAIFKHYLETKSIAETARFLNNAGYRNRKGSLWDRQRLQEILKNPIYIGKKRWNGNLYQGIHKPIITEKQFQSVKMIFKEEYYICPTTNTKGILQRLIYCGSCGHLMTPSYGTSRSKTKYYYYRCTSTNKSEKEQSPCSLRNVSFKVAEKTIIDLIFSLSEGLGFSVVENKALKYNQEIEKELGALKTEINMLKTEKDSIKQKKDRYFDSLISGDFTSSEREKINKRIEEIELEEKQVQARLFKQEFEYEEKKEDLINLMPIKRAVISFKTDHETYNRKAMRAFLYKILERFYYSKEAIKVKFRALPFEITFKT
ncbi:recombinase family protein [Candidatus Margulisiibacteriota bacterium]